MAQLILTGHGEFATGLTSALSMVSGEIPAFSCVTFTENDVVTYADTLTAKIQEGIDAHGSALVFCDLKGGTPFNCSMLSAAQDSRVEVIAGINLPVLIETIFAHQMNVEAPAAELASFAENVAKASIVRENKATFEAQQAAAEQQEQEDGI